MFPWNLFPFNKDTKNKFNQMHPNEIQNYVQEMMDKLMPDTLKKMNAEDMFSNLSRMNKNSQQKHTQGKTLDYLIFETHYHIYVRIPIKDEAMLSKIKIYYTSNQVVIHHIPNQDDKHVISLPSLVKKKGSLASYREGVLEIKMVKSMDVHFAEMDVTEMN